MWSDLHYHQKFDECMYVLLGLGLGLAGPWSLWMLLKRHAFMSDPWQVTFGTLLLRVPLTAAPHWLWGAWLGILSWLLACSFGGCVTGSAWASSSCAGGSTGVRAVLGGLYVSCWGGLPTDCGPLTLPPLAVGTPSEGSVWGFPYPSAGVDTWLSSGLVAFLGAIDRQVFPCPPLALRGLFQFLTIILKVRSMTNRMTDNRILSLSLSTPSLPFFLPLFFFPFLCFLLLSFFYLAITPLSASA